MKKIINIICLITALLALTVSCDKKGKQDAVFVEDEAIKYNQKFDGADNVIVIDGKKLKNNYLAKIPLDSLEGRDILVQMSCEMMIEDPTGTESMVSWKINEPNENFPTLFEDKVTPGKWVYFKSETSTMLGPKRSITLNAMGSQKQNLKIYLKNFKYNVIYDESDETAVKVDWKDAPSLWQAYKDYFDYFGLAVGYKGELNTSEIQSGLKHQVNCYTMGNEFKPDFIFNWQKVTQTVDFTAENGQSYKVPATIDFGSAKECLKIAKDNGFIMRGHVLVWHNQTPDWFFRVNYSQNKNDAFVDKQTMNARLEWYIKTVMKFVDEFEKTENNGNHIIKYWDVVNEAVSDNATAEKWVRENSNWYEIYGNEEFIINAFRYANKYAPKDVLLTYNDYNEYVPAKRDAICTLVQEIKATKDARIDVVGMQAHVKIDWPSIANANDSFEAAVQKYASLGVDVQVTELDIANGKQRYNSQKLREVYKKYFEMFIRNRKTDAKNGIIGVTIWGTTDDRTWLNALGEYSGSRQYPLLFNADYSVKPAFYGVLEAAQDAKGN
ncbi:MAG: endo-1,4-beta-xylanase [Treponema sp.]|nr:endo-1,4-beta-xylanase [Treponema sp.]